MKIQAGDWTKYLCVSGRRDKTPTVRRVDRVELVCGGGNWGYSFVVFSWFTGKGWEWGKLRGFNWNEMQRL